jgi:hypothetical protein
MKTEAQTHPTASNPAPSKRPSGERLTELLEAQRQATSEIYFALRESLLADENVLISPPPQAHIRRMQQLQKAFELYRQAEARLELLVFHFSRYHA